MRFSLKNTIIYVGILSVLVACKKDAIVHDPLLSVPPVQMVHVSAVIQFGETIGPGKESPSLEYILFNEFQWVLAVDQGTVEAVVQNQEFDDYEVRIRYNQRWLLIYDHIINPEVSVGDTITPGQLLGAIGEGNRFELQLNHSDGKSYCPLSYASEAFINAHKDVAETWCIADTVTP